MSVKVFAHTLSNSLDGWWVIGVPQR
jgi:hypothetical protein